MSLANKIRALWRHAAGWKVLTPEEIEGALRLPVLAVVPHLERRNNPFDSNGPTKRRVNLEGRWRSRLLIHFPVDSPAAAAYAVLIEQLQGEARQHGRKAFLCVSSVSGEGTSLSCTNLAIAAKRHNIRSLVVEGHTRAPRISSVLALELEPGLTGCLSRSIPVSHVIQHSQVSGIDVLPAGRAVAYPETLWGTPAFQRVLTEVRAMYDLILFESAPALLYPDASVLADKLDGIVWIHQFGRISFERAQKAIDKVSPHKEKFLGVILNDAPSRFR